MKHRLLFFLLTGFACLLTTIAQADHIIGGDITLQSTSIAGQYSINVHLFIDRTHPNSAIADPFLACHIHRVRDNALMKTTNTFRTNVRDLFETDNICANQVKLQLAEWTYSNTETLSPSTYNDPGGYYIVFQRCCRNAAITNIVNGLTTGTAFKFDFNTIPTGGNSSPEFVFPEAKYACINDPLTMDFSAKDPDGDKLRYEMINPLRGYLTANNPVDYSGTFNRPTYPPVQWQAGTSALNAIPGIQPLRINANSGQITVTPQQVGLYVFAVMVTESRNGVDIGRVRREYQLPVVDCKKNTTTPPPITYNGKSTTAVERCDNSPVTISTSGATGFVFQWQLNGTDIAGATSTTLAVKTEGVYTVKKSFPYNCGTSATSEKVRVLPPVPPLADIVADRNPPQLTFDGDEILLFSAPQPTTYRVRWSLNGVLTGSSNTSLVAGQEGTYKLRVSTSDDRCPSEDTIRIGKFVRLVMPNAFTPNGDKVNETWEVLNLSSLPGAEVFVFNRNGALIYYADKDGEPWDGTYQNQKVQAGMYRYLIRAPGRKPMEGALQVIY